MKITIKWIILVWTVLMLPYVVTGAVDLKELMFGLIYSFLIGVFVVHNQGRKKDD